MADVAPACGAVSWRELINAGRSCVSGWCFSLPSFSALVFCEYSVPASWWHEVPRERTRARATRARTRVVGQSQICVNAVRIALYVGGFRLVLFSPSRELCEAESSYSLI